MADIEVLPDQLWIRDADTPGESVDIKLPQKNIDYMKGMGAHAKGGSADEGFRREVESWFFLTTLDLYGQPDKQTEFLEVAKHFARVNEHLVRGRMRVTPKEEVRPS